MATASFDSLFTGRGALLQTLQEQLQREHIVALNGPAGMGKTELARMYVARNAERYQWILWLNGMTFTTLLATLVEQARQIDLPTPYMQAQMPLVQSLRNWLLTHHDYLLVLDNANDPTLVQALFPARPAGHLLLLADQQVAENQPGFLAVTNLPIEESTQLVLHKAKALLPDSVAEAQRTAALELARELSGQPLALVVAAAYIQQNNYKISEYLKHYRDRGEGMNMQIEAIEIVCNLSLASLETRHPAAAQLLRTCAVLAPDNIPQELFQEKTRESESNNSPFQSFLEEISVPNDLWEILSAYALLTPGMLPRTQTLHQTLHTIVRNSIPAEEQQKLVEWVLLALHQQLPPITGEVLRDCLRYIPHIQQLAEHYEHQELILPQAAPVFTWAATVLYELADYQDALPLLEKSLAIWQHMLGEEHPTTLTTMHNLASLYEKQKVYDRAEEMFQHVLAMRKRVLGDEHTDTVLTLNNLAYLYVVQGKKHEAKELYQQALPLCKRALEPLHPVTGSILYHLALLYTEQGNLAEAEQLLREACTFWEQTKGAECLETARVLHKLALVYLGLEKWQRAEILYRRVRRMYEKHLGEGHPDTIQCLEQGAFLSLVQNNLTEAQQTVRRILKIRKRQARGADTPDTALALSSLAGMYIGMGKPQKAETLLQRAIEIGEVSPELGAPATIMNLVSLAIASVAQEKQDQAISLLQQARALCDETPDSMRPQMAFLREFCEGLLQELK